MCEYNYTDILKIFRWDFLSLNLLVSREIYKFSSKYLKFIMEFIFLFPLKYTFLLQVSSLLYAKALSAYICHIKDLIWGFANLWSFNSLSFKIIVKDDPKSIRGCIAYIFIFKGCSKGRGYMNTNGWFILRFYRKQQNSVKPSFFNEK